MENLEWCGYSMVNEPLRICLDVLTEYEHVTDGHLATPEATLCTASCGNKMAT